MKIKEIKHQVSSGLFQYNQDSLTGFEHWRVWRERFNQSLVMVPSRVLHYRTILIKDSLRNTRGSECMQFFIPTNFKTTEPSLQFFCLFLYDWDKKKKIWSPSSFPEECKLLLEKHQNFWLHMGQSTQDRNLGLPTSFDRINSDGLIRIWV